MKKLIGFLFILFITYACKDDVLPSKERSVKKITHSIITKDYEAIIPAVNPKAVLILFPGYPENAEAIKSEFKVIDIAKENDIAILLMNFNQKLWLESNEKVELATLLQNTLIEHKLPTDNVYIGGFSSGGNVSLLISDFIISRKQFYIDPKGVFIIDSPIDLAGIYYASEKNIVQNFSAVSVEESTWILDTFNEKFGNPNDDISPFEKYAVFSTQTRNTNNLAHLKDTKIRLYTEPDTLWWKKNRMADYEQTNAYSIQKLSETLQQTGFKKVDYIPTQNKGYRANGDRHPHSWSIVDVEKLVHWMLAKN